MRASCDEIREHKKHSKSQATLPVSEDMLLKVRVRCGWRRAEGGGLMTLP
jgi:hypothetical protein